jgi:glycosyltransferase involved in cell wall biosynthesis
MKVLLVHNEYQQPGGEDVVVSNQARFLEERGHHVSRYSAHNDHIREMGSLSLAQTTLWSSSSFQALRAFIHQERPQVAHFHNTFPLISPSGYYAARAEGVPVIQTLHNYRLICPNAVFFRDGHACEDCLGKTPPWPGVVHACYRESRVITGVVATMLTAHRALRTWMRMVDAYVVLTEFMREKYIQGGLPAEKIVVIPNAVYPDVGVGVGGGGYALFVGRLSVEKGIETLLAAWERLERKVPLKIVGDGPLANKVAGAAQRFKDIEWLRQRSAAQTRALMKEAWVLVCPSVWYDGMPLVIVEAYAAGLPVIASNHGSPATLVDHHRTGLLFRPGDPKDLATQVRWALSYPSEFSDMRSEVRAEFEKKYTTERHYQKLMNVYQEAIRGART